MSRVLITGASGFIGSNVLEYLLNNTTWKFVCLSSWRHKGSALNVQHAMHSKRVEIITLDLTGPIPDIGEFDYILNLASESHVDRSIKEPVSFIENNVSSTLQVLEYARQHPPRVFVQFSTDEVYGAMEHKEWDVLLPSNPYAASKAAQEMIAIAYWKTYDLPIVITNSNNIVGPHQDPEKFVPKIIELIRNKQQVTIHARQGRPGRRYWNPVKNTANALLWILENANPARSGDRPDRYALSGGKELNNLEMAQLIAELMGEELNYTIVEAEAVRPGYDEFYAMTEGELDRQGWKAPFTLEDGLKELLK